MFSKREREFISKPMCIERKQHRYEIKKKIIEKCKNSIKDIIFLMRRCKTQEEVIKYIKLHEIKTMDAIWKALDKGKKPPEDIQITTLWDFYGCDERFGIEHPGRNPGQMVLNLLHFYTKEGDVVLDPMAGGGSTIDVCKLMNRRIIAYDISPVRDDIIKHNIMEDLPIENNRVDFVFLDPPYWDMKKGEYTKNESDLSNLSLKNFYNMIKRIAEESYRVLKKDSCVSFVISNKNDSESGFIDFGFDCYQIFKKVGFSLVERISAPYHHATSHTGLWKHRAIENKFMLRGFRDIFIMRKVKRK